MNKYRKFTILAVFSIIAFFIYFGFRLYIFFSNDFGFLNGIFAFCLLFAESHSIIHSFGFVTSVLRLKKKGATYHRHVKLDKKNLPFVTILVPGRNEPLNILETTFICLYSLNYKNKEIVFLDGSDEEYVSDNKKLAKKYGLTYFHPIETPRSKAEIINQYLPEVNSKYFSIFDADQNPMPEFLMEVVAIIEYSRKIAFVQTPQLYTNINISPITKAAALQQSIFYENICESKGAVDAMFCCGTNFVMRTNILKKVGGFDESLVTEDFATSVKIHSLGYRSVYYNHVRVFGMAPETLPAYFKQQFRWSAGSIGVLRKLIISFFNNQLRLSLLQTWEYVLSATYYFVGWSFFLLMVAPASYLIFNVPSYFADPYFYLGSFIPYYVLLLTTFYATMKKRNYKMKNVFIGALMGQLSFPVLMKSTTAALFGKKVKFEVTDKGRTGKMPFLKLWPWILMIILNIIAIIAGVMRYEENHYAIAINIFWCIYHILLLLNIFRFNKSPRFKEAGLAPKYI